MPKAVKTSPNPSSEPSFSEPLFSDDLFSIVYDDDAIAVVNKAAGLVMHANPFSSKHDKDNLAARLNVHYGFGLPTDAGAHRPGIVHRLDKNTSGLLLVARRSDIYHRLKRRFHRHVKRHYIGFVYGVPSNIEGVIDAPIGRDKQDYRCCAVDTKNGKSAKTHYRVLKVLGGKALAASIVCFWLETGRTHQIRVHMAHIGYPIWEDHFYSGTRRGSESKQHRDAIARLKSVGISVPHIGRQALHADQLSFHHPQNGALMMFTAAMPSDMMTFLRALS